MRSVARLTVLAILGVTVGISALFGMAVPDAAQASSGSVRFNPTPAYAPWDADGFTVDIRAENIVTTTTCLTDPEDPGSPAVACGLGSYHVIVSWDSTKMSYVSISNGAFLGSTGRSVSCPVKTSTAGSVEFSCVTLGAVPAGPQGSGVLATLKLHPLVPASGSQTPLTFTQVDVTDVPGNPFPIPATSGTVQFDPCYADIAPTNTLINFSDVLVVLAHFGEEPPSDPKFDPTLDGKVTFNDAIYLLRQFGTTCVAP